MAGIPRRSVTLYLSATMTSSMTLRALLCTAIVAGCRSPAPDAVREPPVTVTLASARPAAATPVAATPVRTPGRLTLASRSAIYGDQVRSDCAVTRSNEVQCWSSALPPTPVAGLRDVASLAAAGHFTCARTASGAVRCWGEDPFTDGNRHCPFEDGTTESRVGRIRGVADDVESLSSGGAMICIRPRGGSLRCTGSGFLRCPTWIAHPDARGILVGGSFDCWLRADGPIACDLGPPKDGDSPIGHSVLPGAHAAFSLAAWDVDGGPQLCAVDGAGAVECFSAGYAVEARKAQAMRLPGPVVQIAAGMRVTCALVVDGSVHCWASTQLSHGLDDAFPIVPAPKDNEPHRIEGLSERAVEISAGYLSACARLESGKVVCFGHGYTAPGAKAPRVVLGD